MSAAGLQRERPLGRVAAIDVGTNSIRLVVVEVAADRTWRILDDEKVTVRLGRGLAECNELAAEAMSDAATAIGRLKAIAEGYGVRTLKAAATWAVRRASNGPDFVALVGDRASLDLHVLTAEEEARLAFAGVRHTFDLASLAVAVMDVGGGSTEIVLGTGEVIDRIYPLALGAVTLAERFGVGAGTDTGRYREMRRYIRRTLEQAVGKPPFVPHLLIGTGGTFTSLAAMSMHRSSGRSDSLLPFSVRGYEVQRSEIKHVLNQLRKMSLRERQRVAGLSPERADIIVAGLAIVEQVLKHLEVNRVRVAEQGIRAGLVQGIIDSLWPRTAPADSLAPNRMRAVRHFASTCRYEAGHAEHVADLAGQIFDQLAADTPDSDAWAVAPNRDLLMTSALLHDVGYLINYSKHHKHSYHLIINSDLPGFTRRELELIANVARYHRGAHPKGGHANFARLAPEDRALVRRLAGILRLAVGLDRSHTQEIRRLRVHCADKTAFIDVEAGRHPSVDLWAGERTCGLFEEACGRRVQFRWTSPAGAGAAAERAGAGRPAGVRRHDDGRA